MVKKKRTWNRCTDREILSVYQEVLEETKRLYPQYFDCDVQFYIDGSTKYLGHCAYSIKKETMYTKFGTKAHFGDLRYENVCIILSKYVTDKEQVRSTLVHEFGHMVTPKEHHSFYWETRANKIGEKWGIECQRLATKEETQSFLSNIPVKQTKDYTVKCSGCGRLVHRKRMCDIIKHPEFWKCGACGSYFEKTN